MKRTIRENIKVPYSLHDMNIMEFDVHENDLIMKTQSGMIKVTEPCEQVDGYVEFYDIDWDFSYVYLLDYNGNIGSFTGEKMMFKDFIETYKVFGLSVIDEVYGYNQTKYWGYLTSNRKTQECIIEIYHMGDMVFIEVEPEESEIDNDRDMQEVILSADDKAKIYMVPYKVAMNLNKYCWEFATNWVWHGPENAKYLKNLDGQFVAVFGVADFIDYLNTWEFPKQHSTLIKELDCCNYELPEEYKNFPKYNF